MFGYVYIDKPELKCRELDEYRAFYCGLCKTLSSEHGFFARLALNYDFTFLSILYSGIYEPELCHSCKRCMVHWCRKHPEVKHEYQTYCADMTVFLTWLKCMDDWNDDKSVVRRLYAAILKKKAARVHEKYKTKCDNIVRLMGELSKREDAGDTDLDMVSGLFGKILEEIFVFKKDEWEHYIRSMGFYLGKFIYLLDAFDDLEKDIKKNEYNPLKPLAQREDLDEYVRQILTLLIAECCKNFHMLPIVEHESILSNILYSGVWTGYERAIRRKEEKQRKENQKKG